MTRSCSSQSLVVLRFWVRTAYDGSSEDLSVKLISIVSYEWCVSVRLTKTIFSHSTHDVKNAFPIVTSLLIVGKSVRAYLCWWGRLT